MEWTPQKAKKTPRLVFPGECYIFFRIATQGCAISKFYNKLEHAVVASRADMEVGSVRPNKRSVN